MVIPCEFCEKPISEERLRYLSWYCSNDCRLEDAKQKRQKLKIKKNPWNESKRAYQTSTSKLMSNYIRLRDGGICIYCQDEIGQDIDHVIPRNCGGKTIKENLVLSCKSCNGKKSNSINEGYLTKAFKHLLSVGESLDWVDGVFHEDKG